MKTIKLIYGGVIHSKKNSKQIITNPRNGKPMITSSSAARAMEEEMAWSFLYQATQQGWEKRLPEQCKDKVYTIGIKLWQKDKRRHDLDNQATSILDALVKAAIIPDDSVKYLTEILVTNYGVDKQNPRAEIEVEEKE